MKKVGISTVYTGFNYGSSLQAFATKVILNEIGYESVHFSLRGSLLEGRDVRLNKIFKISSKVFSHPNLFFKRVKAYKSNIEKKYSVRSRELFMHFIDEKIQPQYKSWKELNTLANQKEYNSFICGSDQVWSGEALFVDPQYYLRYAPKEKRVAFAPSFGSEKVAKFNKKTITKYINEIPYLSVRELSGISIIKNLTGRNAVQLVDPTLVLNKDKWNIYLDIKKEKIKKDYILTYFLSEPSLEAKMFIKNLSNVLGLSVIALPFMRTKDNWFDDVEDAGPIEFLKFLQNSSYVLTDSFHGTAFSVIYNIPFFTFEREYGKNMKQSGRLTSFLKLVNLSERYNPNIKDFKLSIDFSESDNILDREREKVKKYLLSALNKESLNDEK